jgi:SAM-dependent methyltransferase
MGISPYAVGMLAKHHGDGLFREGRDALTLGKQQIHNLDLCNRFLKTANLPLIHTTDISSGDKDLFVGALGFQSVSSLDASTFEGADICHDMNLPVSESHFCRFDLIFNGGTIEHIFDLKMALSNIHNMLRVGGIIIHGAPSNNHVDHGFYQLSPTFFFDYYSVNNYDILKCFFVEYQREHDRIPWKWYEYRPGSLDAVSFGGLNSSLWHTWFVTQKTKFSTSEVIPQQGSYRKNLNWVHGLR